MQASDLREAREFARKYGVKSLAFGPPGSGKTPVANTAPRPVLCACEPGLTSMRTSTVPTWEAYTWARVVEFFNWVFNSKERFNFETVCVDSVSMMAELYLRDNPKKISHGLQLYGEMATAVGDLLHKLWMAERCHTYLIAKQMVEPVTNKLIPYFPGNELNQKVPYLYDEILHLDRYPIPGVGDTRAFQCHSAYGVACRDRSGALAQFEPPNLSAIFAKCQQEVTL